jgi:HD-GYP domain-containing protein (c-di-GMP phosphodiesterase class II)/pSer/pThr/pTyr-binding forkhead associated (FHA) protein
MRVEGELLIVAGPGKGRKVVLGEVLTIGSRSDVDLRLTDASVSPLHARVFSKRGEFFITDLESRRGTRVDGRKVEGEVSLKIGAEISIGPFVLRFHRPDRALRVDKDEVTSPSIDGGLHALPRASQSRQNGPRDTEPEMQPLSAIEPLALVRSHATFELEPLESKSPEEVLRASRHLQVLLRTNSLISTELDVERLFDRLLGAIVEVIPAHRGVIMTVSPTGALEPRAQRTTAAADKGKKPQQQPQVSQTIARRALEAKAGILSIDAPTDRRFGANQSIMDLKIRSVICAPMLYADEVLGLIYLDTLGVTQPFSEGDLSLLTAIAGPAGTTVRNALLVSKLKETAIDTIFRLSVAAEYRDDETGFHIHRMSDYAEAIARSLGQSAEYCERIKLSAPLHDIGKIGIPDAILRKPGKLTDQEFDVMKEHPVKGGEILAHSQSDLLQMGEQIALSHHEKYDGSGYPRKLSREAIPLEGRIVALADVFDALLSKRVYKPAWPVEKAFEYVRSNSGKHFDPKIVDAFFAAEKRVLEVKEHYERLEVAGEATPEEGTSTEDIPKQAS